MKKVFFISILIFAFCGCKKSDPVVQIDSRLKAGFNFQPGTYWIYKDSISGQVDSFFVRYNSLTTNPAGIGTQYIITIYVSEYQINAINLQDTTQWVYKLADNEFDVQSNCAIALTNEGKSIQYGEVFSFPMVVGTIYDYSGIENKLISILSSLVINTKSYANVSTIHSFGTNFTIDNWSIDNLFYVCDSVGFLKIIQNQPLDSLHKVWELQRYNIVL